MYHFIALMARMRYIARWSLMVSRYPENVAEHSLQTAVLAHTLAVIGRDVLGKADADPDAATSAALFHDAPEILTGDLPTPVKYFDPELRDAYRRVEESAVEKLMTMLPEALRPAYEPLLRPNELPETTARYVRAADKLSAYLKCLEELRAGNPEFSDAARQCRDKLDRMGLPEIDYFMASFLPSFELTLDELR